MLGFGDGGLGFEKREKEAVCDSIVSLWESIMLCRWCGLQTSMERAWVLGVERERRYIRDKGFFFFYALKYKIYVLKN